MKTILSIICVVLSSLTWAQSSNIKIVVPYPAGGPADIMARTVQQELESTMKKNIIVEYRPGASSTIGTAFVANSSVNETVLLVNSSATYMNTMIKKNTGYTDNQLVPLTYLGNCPMVLVVSNKLGVKNFNEFKKLNPKKPLNFGSSGPGSSTSLPAEYLQKQLDKNFTNIPYKGTSPVLVDLVAGNIDFAFINYPITLPFIESNKFTPIAIYATHRLKELPNVPSYADLNLSYPGDISWYMIWSNQNINFEDQKQIQETMLKVVNTPKKLNQFKEQGLTINAKNVIPTKEFVLKLQHDTQKLLKNLGYETQD